MLVPSANLAGLLVILGGVLGWTSYRNLSSPAPHYAKTDRTGPSFAAWLGLGIGLVMLVLGLVMAVQVTLDIYQSTGTTCTTSG
jgi:hypothetical protein